jgi:WD40 repeat protein
MSAVGPCIDDEAAVCFLEGEMPDERSREIEQHIEDCSNCRRLLASLAGIASEAEPIAGLSSARNLPAADQRYTVLGEHARGGQARILIAFDENVGREVALKELLPGGSGSSDDPSWRDATARFLREAELTGQLVHPGVVSVFEIGRRPDGTFFYTMELVHGRTLSEVLSQRPPMQDRLGLLSHFLSVCHVVAYAHSRGIVHRDIKPQNIMVGEFGETVLLDWGLAKERDEDDDLQASPLSPRAVSPSPDATREGTIIGTPGYMSPEQAGGRLGEVDERSDIYGLGAVLFEVLTGLSPAQAAGALGAGAEAGRARSLSSGAPPELQAVAEKALAPRKEDRYQRASELAQEVTAFMTGGRVRAFSYTRWDLVRRFAAGHKPLLTAVAAMVAVVLSAFVLITLAWRSELTSRRAAEASGKAAQESEKIAAARGRDALQGGAKLALSQGDKLQARAKLRGALELGDSLAARAMWRELRSDPERFAVHFSSSAYAVAFSPNSSELAVGLQDASVHLVDRVSRSTRILRGGGDQIDALAYSRDGERLAAGTLSGQIALWDRSGGLTHLGERGPRIQQIAFSPDGAFLASASVRGQVDLWDASRASLQAQLPMPDPWVMSVAFSPDGRHLAASSLRNPAMVWDIAAKTPVLRFPGSARALAYSPDGDWIAGGDSEGNVHLWRSDSGELVRRLRGHGAWINRVTFSSNRRWLASASGDGTVRLWDLRSGDPARVLSMRNEAVSDVAFSADSSLLAGAGGLVRVWEVGVFEGRHEPSPPSKALNEARFGPDGTHIASVGTDGSLQIWEASGHLQSSWPGHASVVQAACISPDGRLLASASWDGLLIVQDASTGAARNRFSVGDRLLSIACAPDNRHLALGGSDGVLRIHDLISGELRRAFRSGGTADPIYALVYTPDERHLIAGRKSGRIEFWSLGSASLDRVLLGHTEEVIGLALDARGKMLASGGIDQSVRVWRMADGSGRILGKSPGRVYKLAWEPGSQRIAAPISTGEVMVWDLSTNAPPKSFAAHDGEVNSIDFAPDGKSAVTAGDDGVLRLWDTSSWSPKWYTRAVVWAPGPEILNHRGWMALDTSSRLAPMAPAASPPAWRRAVESSRKASMQPAGPLCIARENGVELWDVPSDRLQMTVSVGSPFEIASISGGCSVLKEGRATLYRPGEPAAEVASGVLLQSGGEEKLATVGREVLLFDPLGRSLGAYGTGAGITAAFPLGKRMAVGFKDGGIELREGGERLAIFFRETPDSAVTRLGPGPNGTLVAGFANGSFGVWSLSSGEPLGHGAVHGAIRHLLLHDGVLLVASEVGATATMDLSVLTADYCDLLEEVWSRIPVLWRDQGAVVLAPEPKHGCRSRP